MTRKSSKARKGGRRRHKPKGNSPGTSALQHECRDILPLVFPEPLQEPSPDVTLKGETLGPTRESSPAPGQPPAGPHAHTCGEYAVLDICELAHREVTGKPLCLGEADLKLDQLREHIARCPACGRWFRNARRAYERLASPGAPPLSTGVPAYQPRPRTLRVVPLAADGPGTVLTEAERPGTDAQQLDALYLHVDWRQDPRGQREPGRSRWWATVRFMGRGKEAVGNDEEELERYDGLRVRLDFRVRGRTESLTLLTRLGLDPQKNLVSTARRLDIAHPDDVESFVITPLERGEGLDGS